MGFEEASSRPSTEGCKVKSPVSGVWSPYRRKTEEAEDMDGHSLQDGENSALTHREHNKEMIRGERLEMNDAEREVFYRIL